MDVKALIIGGAIIQNNPNIRGNIIGKNIMPVIMCFSVILPNKNKNGIKIKRKYGGIAKISELIKSDDKFGSILNSKKGNGKISGINKQTRKYVRAHFVAFISLAICNFSACFFPSSIFSK